MGSYEKNFVWGGGGGNKLIASEKLIKVYLLWPIQKKVTMKKKKHAPLQDSVREYIREISVRTAMFLQIQTDIQVHER